MRGPRLVWLFGIALVIVGLVPVLVFTLAALLPGAEASALLGIFPELPGVDAAGKWLSSRRVKWAPSSGLILAVLGVAVMYLGAAIANWQQSALDAQKARKADARRRRREYGPHERIEPTLL